MELISEMFEGVESSLFKTYEGSVREIKKSGAPRSERQELVQYFQDRLRDKAGKPFRYIFLNMRLAHLNIQDLYYLKSICCHADCFDKCFWGSLKPRLSPSED